MTFLGVIAAITLLLVVFDPDSVGEWCAKVKRAYDKAMKDDE